VGEKRHLSFAQEIGLQRRIQTEMPKALGLLFAPWTWQAVQVLIEQDHGAIAADPDDGAVFAAVGIHVTSQKPLRKVYEQDPKAVVDRWLHPDAAKYASTLFHRTRAISDIQRSLMRRP